MSEPMSDERRKQIREFSKGIFDDWTNCLPTGIDEAHFGLAKDVLELLANNDRLQAELAEAQKNEERLENELAFLQISIGENYTAEDSDDDG